MPKRVDMNLKKMIRNLDKLKSLKLNLKIYLLLNKIKIMIVGVF